MEGKFYRPKIKMWKCPKSGDSIKMWKSATLSVRTRPFQSTLRLSFSATIWTVFGQPSNAAI